MTYLRLFLSFFKIGAFTFGGGYAMLPLIEEEVIKKGWLTAEEIVNFVAVSESTPGPFAVNIATYIGNVIGAKEGTFGSLLGSLASTLGVVLPSFLIILAVSGVYERFNKSNAVKGLMTGLKPAVIGLIGAAVISVGKTVFSVNAPFSVSREFILSAVIFAFAAFLAYKKFHPIAIIVLSAFTGIAAGYLAL